MKRKEAVIKVKELEKEIIKLKIIIAKPTNFIDEIKTYKDVCNELGEEEITKDDFSEDFDEETIEKLINFAKLKQIEKLFNQEWKPNWKDLNEYKYYPYYECKTGGLVFGRSFGYFAGACGDCAVFKTREISNYIGNTFIDIYKKLI